MYLTPPFSKKRIGIVVILLIEGRNHVGRGCIVLVGIGVRSGVYMIRFLIFRSIDVGVILAIATGIVILAHRARILTVILLVIVVLSVGDGVLRGVDGAAVRRGLAAELVAVGEAASSARNVRLAFPGEMSGFATSMTSDEKAVAGKSSSGGGASTAASSLIVLADCVDVFVDHFLGRFWLRGGIDGENRFGGLLLESLVELGVLHECEDGLRSPGPVQGVVVNGEKVG